MKLTIFAILVLSVVAASNAHYITIQNLTDRANYYRQNPHKLAAFIKSNYLGSNGVNCSTGVHQAWRLLFREKCAAINEVIAKLYRLPAKNPLPTLKIDMGMTRQAYEHSQFQVQRDRMGHDGPPGREGLSQRLQLYNHFRGCIAENIITANEQYSASADKIIANWCIDDNVKSRGHYINLFNGKYNSWGPGIYPTYKNGKKVDWVTTFFGT